MTSASVAVVNMPFQAINFSYTAELFERTPCHTEVFHMGRSGALVDSTPFVQMVAGSNLALAAT